jgi:predicted DCC family thiol-disulfide oxidoreductase YuxK
MPEPIFAAAWILMAVGYSYSGYSKLVSPSWLDGTALARVLDNPLARPGPLRAALLALPGWLLQGGTWIGLALELFFAPLALVPRLRPWLWGLLLLMHVALIALVNFADLSLGMVMLHFFTFNPAWVKPLGAPTEMIFYDSHCGLCHRAVRFVLAEDRAGDTFRFAPLDSDAFRSAVPEADRVCLPDTLVVRASSGALLTRSTAVLWIARRLGGVWRILGELGLLIPVVVRDRIYDGVASGRHRLFRRPANVCPIVPHDLRKRFDI